MPRPDPLSLAQARRTALAAQGFTDPQPVGRVDRRHLRRVLDRVHLLQVDSVNVLVRAHYLPLLSRLGPYPTALLDRAAHGPLRERELVEYWAHEASLVPLRVQPLLRWRMRLAREQSWGRMRRVVRERPEYVAQVLETVGERGPVSAGEVEARPRGAGPWWDWSDAKTALEYLFWSGQVTTATRRGFERLYDLPERVLPASVLQAPTPEPHVAARELVALALRAHGVATAADLRDYWRLGVEQTRDALADLVDDGRALPVAVQGWRQPAYLDPAARLPRRVAARALLAPFDPLVWTRQRTSRLFGFDYRLEIYVPADRRVHGYYVLPFLLGDRLVARVDLKAARAGGRLLVQAAHAEPGSDPAHVALELAEELAACAAWLGLPDVVVVGRGDLAGPLAATVRR